MNTTKEMTGVEFAQELLKRVRALKRKLSDKKQRAMVQDIEERVKNCGRWRTP
jgi:hypothetical protein